MTLDSPERQEFYGRTLEEALAWGLPAQRCALHRRHPVLLRPLRVRAGHNKKFCRKAPGQGICTSENNECAGNGLGCNDGGIRTCACWVTSRGYSFCGSSKISCFACETNADCEQRTGGRPGERCIECSVCGTASNNRGCVRECADPA